MARIEGDYFLIAFYPRLPQLYILRAVTAVGALSVYVDMRCCFNCACRDEAMLRTPDYQHRKAGPLYGRLVSPPCLTFSSNFWSPGRASCSKARFSSGPPTPSKSFAFVWLCIDDQWEVCAWCCRKAVNSPAGGGVDRASLVVGDLAVVALARAVGDLCAGELALDVLVDARVEGYSGRDSVSMLGLCVVSCASLLLRQTLNSPRPALEERWARRRLAGGKASAKRARRKHTGVAWALAVTAGTVKTIVANLCLVRVQVALGLLGDGDGVLLGDILVGHDVFGCGGCRIG